MNLLEQFYIYDLCTQAPSGYNIKDGGGGGGGGYKFTDEQRANVSARQKGRPSPRKGCKCSEETKQKIREARAKQVNTRKGVPHSEETKAKISKSNKGRPNPKNSYKRSEETKAKISASKKGQGLGVKISDAARQRRKEGWIKRKQRELKEISNELN
jgi:group I intron endonuclease